MLRLGYLALFFLLCPLPIHAQDPSSLAEEFIELIVGKSKGTSFYSVMMNEQEEPYLDVAEVMSDWLEIATECQVERQYCQGTRYPDQTVYWIDVKQRRFGNSRFGQYHKPIPAADIAFIDNKVWLKYNHFSEWLPVSTTWTLFRYSLALVPNYPTLKQLKQKRAIDRKRQHREAEKKRRIAEAPRLTPADEYPLQWRYDVKLGLHRDSGFKADVGSQFLSDLFGGTLSVRGSYNNDNAKARLDGYSYEHLELPWFHRLRLGDSHSFSSLLTGSHRLKNAVDIQTREKVRGAGKFEYYDVLRPGTEVDVFRNGVLLDTITTDDTGEFHLPEQFASGGDIFTFRKYYKNGQIESDLVKIAPDKALLLEKGGWDFNAVKGDIDEGKLLQTNVRYGLFDALTLGAHFNRADLYEPIEQYAYSYRREQGWSFDATMRIAGQTNLQYEYLGLGKSHYQALSASITALPGQQLFVNYFKVSPAQANDSDFLPRSDLVDSLLTVDHSLYWQRWNIISQFSHKPGAMQLEQSFSRRLNRKMTFNGGYTLGKSDKDGVEFSAKLGSSLTPFSIKNIQMAVNMVDTDVTADLIYRLQGTSDIGSWDIDARLSHDLGGKSRMNLAASWRFSRSGTLGFTSDGHSFGLQFRWQGAGASDQQRLDFSQFGSGTVYGNIKTPGKKGKPSMPVAGLRIFADNQVGRTDEHGDFAIRGVPTNSDVVVRYDNNTLDVDYMMARAFDKVRLRPGTRLKLSPKVVGSVGLDGVVLSKTPLPPQTELEISNSKDGSHVLTIAVEPDGFFLTEQLVAGDYTLRVVNIDNPPPPCRVKIGDKQDWISGIELPRPGVELKSELPPL